MAKVFIGTPSGVAPRWNFLNALHAAVADAAQNGIESVFFQMVGDALLPSARARLLYCFLKTDCTHFLSIDDDVGLPPHAITKLVSRQKDVIGGLYRQKDASGMLCVWLEQGDHPCFSHFKEAAQRDEPAPIRWIGTGCLMVTRGAVLKMIHDNPELAYNVNVETDRDATGLLQSQRTDKMFALYHPIIHEKGYLHDDQSFCERATASGYTVYADPNVQCKHWGEAVFEITGSSVFENIDLLREHFEQGLDKR